MLVLVVNNSLTLRRGTIYSWKGRGPAVTTLLSPPLQFPFPRREGSSSLLPWIRQAVLLLVGAGRPWTAILWEKSHAAPTSSPPQDSVHASCTNFFKKLLKQAWEKAMLVGLPCVLEEKVLLWDDPSNSPPLPGHGCTLTPLELTTLRGSRILSDEQVSNGV